MAFRTSSGISSSLYKVDSSDEIEVRADWTCGGCRTGSCFGGLRLGLVRPEGASGIEDSSSRRLFVSEETDCSERWRLCSFLGLGVLICDAGTPYSLGPWTLVGDAACLLLQPLSGTLPARSLFSVDLRISDKVESVDCCLPLGLEGVLGKDRTGLAAGLGHGLGMRETSFA